MAQYIPIKIYIDKATDLQNVRWIPVRDMKLCVEVTVRLQDGMTELATRCTAIRRGGSNCHWREELSCRIPEKMLDKGCCLSVRVFHYGSFRPRVVVGGFRIITIPAETTDLWVYPLSLYRFFGDEWKKTGGNLSMSVKVGDQVVNKSVKGGDPVVNKTVKVGDPVVSKSVKVGDPVVLVKEHKSAGDKSVVKEDKSGFGTQRMTFNLFIRSFFR